MKTIKPEDVYTQEGGATDKFKEFIVLVPLNHLNSAIDSMKDDPNRIRILQSIESCINEHYQSMMDHKASQETAMNFCQDITLWYANEVIEGRAKVMGLVN